MAKKRARQRERQQSPPLPYLAKSYPAAPAEPRTGSRASAATLWTPSITGSVCGQEKSASGQNILDGKHLRPSTHTPIMSLQCLLPLKAHSAAVALGLGSPSALVARVGGILEAGMRAHSSSQWRMAVCLQDCFTGFWCCLAPRCAPKVLRGVWRIAQVLRAHHGALCTGHALTDKDMRTCWPLLALAGQVWHCNHVVRLRVCAASSGRGAPPVNGGRGLVGRDACRPGPHYRVFVLGDPVLGRDGQGLVLDTELRGLGCVGQHRGLVGPGASSLVCGCVISAAVLSHV
jgi:hypothetical protein